MTKKNDLAYFSEESVRFDDYVEAVEWAQDYALLNRSRMMAAIVEAMKPFRQLNADQEKSGLGFFFPFQRTMAAQPKAARFNQTGAV